MRGRHERQDPVCLTLIALVAVITIVTVVGPSTTTQPRTAPTNAAAKGKQAMADIIDVLHRMTHMAGATADTLRSAISDAQAVLDKLDSFAADAEDGGQLIAASGIGEGYSAFIPERARLVAPDETIISAQATALREAAIDARTRGDLGKEGGVEAWDYLFDRARKLAAE